MNLLISGLLGLVGLEGGAGAPLNKVLAVDLVGLALLAAAAALQVGSTASQS